MKKTIVILLIVLDCLLVYFICLEIFNLVKIEKDWSVFNNIASPVIGTVNIIVLIIIAIIANSIGEKTSEKNIASQKKLMITDLNFKLYNELTSVLDRITFIKGDYIGVYSISEISFVKSYIFSFQTNYNLFIDELIKDKNVIFDIQNSLAGMARCIDAWQKNQKKELEDEYRSFLVTYFNQATLIKTSFQLSLKD